MNQDRVRDRLIEIGFSAETAATASYSVRGSANVGDDVAAFERAVDMAVGVALAMEGSNDSNAPMEGVTTEDSEVSGVSGTSDVAGSGSGGPGCLVLPLIAGVPRQHVVNTSNTESMNAYAHARGSSTDSAGVVDRAVGGASSGPEFVSDSHSTRQVQSRHVDGQTHADFVNIAARAAIAQSSAIKKKSQSDKAGLLKQIQEDRLRMKERRMNSAAAVPVPANPSTASAATSAPSHTLPQQAKIQFRLHPSIGFAGQPITHSFSASDSLASLFRFLRATVPSIKPLSPSAQLQLCAAFPVRIFDELDGTNETRSLQEVQLTPSAVLNVVVLVNTSAPVTEPAITAQVTTAAAAAAARDSPSSDPMIEDAQEESFHPHSQPANQTDDEANASESESDLDENNGNEMDLSDDSDHDANEEHSDNDDQHNNNSDDDDDDGHDDEEEARGFHGAGRRLVDAPALGIPGRRNETVIRAPNRNNFGRGGGQRLGGAVETSNVGVGGSAAVEQSRAFANRDLRLNAIQNRLLGTGSAEITQSSAAADATFSRKMGRKPRSPPSLLQLSVIASVSLLCLHGNKKKLEPHQQHTLRRLGAELAHQVITGIIKARHLDRFMITRLAMCPVKSYNLDSYSLATDSLLETISFTHWNTLTHISLKGGSLITDEGVFHLQTCRSLEYLDLSACRLTDTIFSVLTSSFGDLSYLNLSRTKITSAGLKRLCQKADRLTQLESLLLAGCANVTSPYTLVDLSVFTKSTLSTLSLQACPLVCPLIPPPPGHTHALNVLDMSHIPTLLDEDFVTISTFTSLTDLDLTGSGGASLPASPINPADSAAAAATARAANEEEPEEIPTVGQRMLVTRLCNVEQLKLPFRSIGSINTLLRMQAGGMGIGSSASCLHTLDLSGYTCLTDAGLAGLSGFKNTLKVLRLSGTKVTEIGLRTGGVGNLTVLAEINLDRTFVGDGIFSAIRDLPLLEVLSLSNTNVTDLGATELSSCRFQFSLKRLNLAYTNVTVKGLVKGVHKYAQLISLNVERSGVVSVEQLMHKLEVASRSAGVVMHDAMISGWGVRWLPEEVAAMEGLQGA
ncbi:hypothetical protein CcCBS67573_g00339 [Chytriomyces confervae]|uniref:UBX domain-containing protein n=1 Tax=Chytriomyces confervae TaxID=246404 RepID=A0A507FPL5_9FUNG|nr:hypothetical protein CcCBS67573_g00339 [Chytriomyces confervae]